MKLKVIKFILSKTPPNFSPVLLGVFKKVMTKEEWLKLTLDYISAENRYINKTGKGGIGMDKQIWEDALNNPRT